MLGVGSPGARTAPIRYRLADAGNVSLAVYDAQGVLVREILRAVPQSAGEHVVDWDATALDRKPVAPG